MNRSLAAAMLVFPGIGAVAHAQTFISVPIAQGFTGGNVRQISGDGLSVVGRTGDNINTTRWTIGGPTEVIAPPAGYISTLGAAIGGTGNKFAYEVFSANFTRATVQASGGQSTIITPFDSVNGISRDGSTIVGFNGGSPNTTAVRWTASGGVQGFGQVQGAPLGSQTAFAQMALAASFSGSHIVGFANVLIDNSPPFGVRRSVPFIWSAAAGTRLLTNADGTVNLNDAVASDITSDGSVVVGQEFTNTSARRLFRWTQLGGYQYFNSNADVVGNPSVSDDGNAIIALREYWSPGTGVIPLTQLLTQAGCNFTGWTNLSAVDISGDGRTIAGNGTNPQGQQQGWVATVPGPGGVVMVSSVGLLALATRRRRR